MPTRALEGELMRHQAKRLRRVAMIQGTRLSVRLNKMADEMERIAEDLIAESAAARRNMGPVFRRA
jgi:hypothetical protein